MRGGPLIGSAFCVMVQGMMTRASWPVMVLACAALWGCGPKDAIDPDGSVFSGIASDETVRLLGTEPFWDIDIALNETREHQATITTLGFPQEIEARTIPVERFAGNNGVAFSGEIDGAALEIAIAPGDCNDAMSDRQYPFTATVQLGEAVLFGCAYSDNSPFTGPAQP